jgi:hypothetical protein
MDGPRVGEGRFMGADRVAQVLLRAIWAFVWRQAAGLSCFDPLEVETVSIYPPALSLCSR